MRIIIVDTTLQGPVIGGAQTFLPLLIKGLIGRGHEVHLVGKHKIHERIKKQIIESGAILHLKLFKKKALAEDMAPIFANWVNQMAPELYLISVSPDIGWLALPFLNPQIATVTVGHTDAETFYLPARHYHSFLSHAIGVSKEICQGYISTCNLSTANVSWIPYGVEISSTDPVIYRDEEIKLIYVGRLEQPQKRIFDLAKIAKTLSLSNVKYHLTIIGDGPEKQKLFNMLSSEIQAGDITFTGWLESKDVIKHYKESEIFLLTSEYEGFCIALIEAMANGCCPLVTDINSGNKDLIKHGFNGYIMPIGDTDAFVEKIKMLNNNLDLISQLRRASWERGKEYSISRMIDTYETTFKMSWEKAILKSRKVDEKFPVMESCRSSYPLWIRRIKKIITD